MDAAFAGEHGIEVLPIGIVPLDEVDLPVTQILLERLLPTDGVSHRFVRLVPDEPFQPVPLGEARKPPLFVLADPREQLAGDADVERPMLPVRHHVDGDEANEEIARAHAQAWCSWVAGTSPAMTVG